MRLRIRDVLLVSSLYDSYLFEEDGRLYELIRNEYQGLNLSHSPELTRVSSGSEAISLAKEEKRFDLIITTLHIEDMHSLQFAKAAKAAGLTIPIILLAFDNRELAELLAHHDTSVFDRIFIWQGDFRLVIAIIKHLEDMMNVEHDTKLVGVQSIILIEDNIRFYSSFLPLIYTEILKQSQRLISEGINLSHRFLRMRARPKILLCTNYDEAWKYFEKFQEHILGVISDVDFYRNGKPDSQAGLEFARNVKSRQSDIPILLQSNQPENEKKAYAVGASFVLKDSPLLLNEVRQFMNTYFSFGDFIFRTPEGIEVGRSNDLRTLEEQLQVVPEESLRFHGERNHFSNWLKARTEFWLAQQLRPRKVVEYASIKELRDDLINSLHSYRIMQQRGLITDFVKDTFDPSSSFARIGAGSLGGKARGLGFLNMLINYYRVREKFSGIQIYVPSGVVIATEVFDQFLEENNLRSFAMSCSDDQEITRRFLEAEKFPEQILGELAAFLDIIREPLAVRSSSLLEDSQYQPFAGVYETYMIPNNNPNPFIRLGELINSIKRVYASTFYQAAKDYIKVTSYRLEEEKMAVIIQKMIGSRYHNRFYPNISGVAKSYNFYPVAPQLPTDGTVSVALGLGKMVVDGGPTVRFCPKYPNRIQQLATIKDTLANNQHEFFALDLSAQVDNEIHTYDTLTKTFNLDVAEQDGTLSFVGSTYSHENDRVYEGIARQGLRLVTFAPIMKSKLLPLPEILELLLDMGTWGMGTPVEMEFAVNMNVPQGKPKEFGVLQMRPLVVSREFEELNLDSIDQSTLICQSSQVLGNGKISNIYDVIVVDFDKYERAKSQEVAREVGQFNGKLVSEGKPYLLIGVGRWGTLDPWLGIPVRWDQISGAKAIVESGFKDFAVEPSQGSHFFQNLTAFMIGYFSVNPHTNQGFVDWEWLKSQPTVEEKLFTRHLQFDNPLIVKMNGHQHKGIILKPENI
ncbi:MAG: histidine kinase [Ignavibacteriae bacterium]|nr:histidine kinase [Ignavibacteriota bacterium]